MVEAGLAVGRPLAHRPRQASGPKALELEQAHREEKLPFLPKDGGTSSSQEPLVSCQAPQVNEMCGELRQGLWCPWSTTLAWEGLIPPGC